MSPIVYRMNDVLSQVVQRVPVGTNLGLFHLLWMLLSGRLLLSRGAVIPGLAALGLAEAAVRRAWAALAYGKWHAAQLLAAWEQLVREERPFAPISMGGIVRSPVTSSASSVPASRTVRPSTTRPPRARPCPPFRWALQHVLARLGRSAWPCLACWSGARRPIPAKPTYRPACSSGPTSNWRPTKPWSAIEVFPSGSSKPQASNAMSSARPSTSQRDGLPSQHIKARGVHLSVERWPVPSRVRTKAAPLPRLHRTATKHGSSVLAQPPWRSTRRFGTT
jgi:hypothetical protein